MKTSKMETSCVLVLSTDPQSNVVIDGQIDILGHPPKWIPFDDFLDRGSIGNAT